MKKRPYSKKSRSSARHKNNSGTKPRHESPKEPQKKSHKDLRANLYGYHAVSAAWLNPNRNIHAFYLTEQALKGVQPLLDNAVKTGLKRPAPSLVDKKQIDKILPHGSVHQGLALHAGDLPETSVHDLIIQNHTEGHTLLVMLDQVTDPHNVGAILRSVCAFGAHGVIMQRKHAPDLTGVLAKTACGAVEHTPVAFETNLNRTLETLKEAGYFVYGLDERGETSLPDVKPHKKSVVVLGAEGPGLRRLVRENCDSLVRLPTTGPVSSLNVSNAAVVALYALTQHRSF